MTGRDADQRRRIRARVTGVVQGVGFRPHVYRLASALELSGHVRNDARGVLLEVEGRSEAVDAFLDRLRSESPPLAEIEEVGVEPLEPAGEEAFRIVASDDAGAPDALVSPDTATCDDCLRELFDPADRRYRYPFINCTNCGPRFTIVRGVPYDRPLTTMADFEMCPPCREEYGDPADRRFHAQPNACPDCGPTVSLLDAEGVVRAREDEAVLAAASALLDGRILAVKGLGGFHLACRADDQAAASRLRQNKHREDKPFALMVPDLEAARRLVHLGEREEGLLSGRERPIVLARRRSGADVAGAVAPGHRDLGVMLPYSPLHHLLLRETGVPLVMTSGNVSDEPIAYRNRDARDRLADLVDGFLSNDRPIHMRTDDSVVRVVGLPEGRRPLVLRRSRGWVPRPLPLPGGGDAPDLLACGAHLKNTFTVARDGRAWVGHHIGDLENYEAYRSFREGVDHFEELFSVSPEVVVHDLHAAYLSSQYARERQGTEARGVQHHFAHLAACLGEHGESGPALGVIYDGTGYGTDGTVWGGELLLGDRRDFQRLGHLWPVRLPGGEAAVRQPWRMACAWLDESLSTPAKGPAAAGEGRPAGEEDRARRAGRPERRAGGAERRAEAPPLPPTLRGQVASGEWEMIARLARTGVASPVTTSMGRLFDAVAALCGVRSRVNYEGQAAIELEMAAAGADEVQGYRIPLVEGKGAAAGTGESLEERRAARSGRSVRGGSDDGLPRDERPAGDASPGEASASVGAPAPDVRLILDPRPMIREIADDVGRGVGIPAVAARFHRGVAEATARACRALARRAGVETVVLSGGVFQNVLLLETTAALLSGAGLRPLVPERLPPNDGGISYGQAVVGAARFGSGARRGAAETEGNASA